MEFNFVQGMPRTPRSREEEAEEKMRQEAEMMAMRVQGRGPDAMREYQSMPMPGDEDSPETHQALMARGRELAGEFDPLDAIGGAALDTQRRASAMAPRSGGDGISQIGDYASQLLARARAQSAMRQRGGGRR